jgi:hypothetical protein
MFQDHILEQIGNIAKSKASGKARGVRLCGRGKDILPGAKAGPSCRFVACDDVPWRPGALRCFSALAA